MYEVDVCSQNHLVMSLVVDVIEARARKHDFLDFDSGSTKLKDVVSHYKHKVKRGETKLL